MDIVSIIVAAVGSGLVATIITLIVQRVSETRKLKICIFEILMSHRYLIADKENVEALNKVEVIFHKDSEVRKAWTDFLNAADAGATNPTLARTTNDKYLKLLEKIAKNIGYKNIDWENIKHFYFPQGLATKITEEELLRKAQLSQATAIAAQDTSTGQSSSEQLGMQIALKALENPDGFEKLARFAERANQGKKTEKGKVNNIMKRIVTYDVKNGNSYEKFYQFAAEASAEKITESSYLFDTELTQEAFAKKLRYCFNKGDNVSYISCNSKEGLFYIRVKVL